MKKFIVVEGGNEIKLGDNIVAMFNIETPLGIMDFERSIQVTKPVLIRLIKNKKVKVVEDNSVDYQKIWDNAFNSILEKTGWTEETLTEVIKDLKLVNPWAVTQLILKEIAIELDKKYKDHINNSEKIYAISPQDGRIHEIHKKTVKNYRAFPAFRNIEDAKIACYLVRDYLKDIFND